MLFNSKKLDFSDDEDQYNEKSNKQSLNGDIRSKSDVGKGYMSNKITNSDPNLKVFINFALLIKLNIYFFIFPRRACLCHLTIIQNICNIIDHHHIKLDFYFQIVYNCIS